MRLIICLFLEFVFSLANPRGVLGDSAMMQDFDEFGIKSEFRYIIVDSSINRDNPKEPVRVVTILLDEKSFSDDTLRKLYALVSKRLPRPKLMKIWVYTSMEQIATPEEEENPVASHIRTGKVGPDKYYHAFMLRQDGNALFWYYNLDGTEIKTIIIKGKNPLLSKGK
ncbi:MAG: hypothetical protein HY231_18260 [Acidobacteria bacterium]|nr:hypothetical protein [Acidobacteriota bacterium]